MTIGRKRDAVIQPPLSPPQREEDEGMHTEVIALIASMTVIVLETAVIFVLIHHVRKLDEHTKTLDQHLEHLHEHTGAIEGSVARLCQCVLPTRGQDAEEGPGE